MNLLHIGWVQNWIISIIFFKDIENMLTFNFEFVGKWYDYDLVWLKICYFFFTSMIYFSLT